MTDAPSLRLPRRIAVAIVVYYASWMGMLALHELGHIIGAWLTGGRVISVSIPPFGFSQTIVHPNPREGIVVWCGPILGAMLPLLAVLVTRAFRGRVPNLLLFYGGFCAIANGAYIGVGWIWHSGDAGDLMRLGHPAPLLVVFGLISAAAGLWCWHFTGFGFAGPLRRQDMPHRE
jgi:hypothetical protein